MFFFQRNGEHRDIHSFPTRRSSDLLERGRVLHLLLRLLPARGVRAVHRHVQDRKSTRLNSSHMSISYAVFCLKKKTTNKCATWRKVSNAVTASLTDDFDFSAQPAEP